MARKETFVLEKRKHRKLAKVRNAEYLRAYKEYHKCCKCGEGRAVCLDLHHLDPVTKRFKISDAIAKSFKDIVEELEKCIVVCANCHRLMHAETELDRMEQYEEKMPLFE